DGSKTLRLTKSPGTKELVTFSPNGEWIAFVKDQNLYAVDLATQKEHKLTSDGGGKIFNGKADWVYYEEVFDRDYKAFWWSPDSSAVAFLHFDDRKVSQFTLIDPTERTQTPEVASYPLAGGTNPVVKLGIANVASGAVNWVDLSD